MFATRPVFKKTHICTWCSDSSIQVQNSIMKPGRASEDGKSTRITSIVQGLKAHLIRRTLGQPRSICRSQKLRVQTSWYRLDTDGNLACLLSKSDESIHGLNNSGASTENPPSFTLWICSSARWFSVPSTVNTLAK